MRAGDLADYVALRRWVDNPLEVARFRKGQREGDVLEIRLKGAVPLLLRGGTADYHTFHRIFLCDEYRLGDVGSRPWECVVDLGANAGIFAARAAPMAKRVLSFEPIPEQFEQLERNGRPGVILVPEAVAGEAGTLRLYRTVAKARTGSASAFPTDGHDQDDYADATATTLDALFAQYAIVRCDLLKLDVEGAEYDILYAASAKTLARVQRIHAEYHQARADDPRTQVDALVAFLAEQGFGVETVPHRKKPNRGLLFATR
jgi:FkbM family methyltransferase